MKLDSRDLQYFAEILDCGSITAAAEQLGISQPALTKRIRLLEMRLGIKLLNRNNKGVTATIYGENLYLHAKSITAEVARAQAKIEELSQTGGGTLSIGVLPTQATELLPEVIVRLTVSLPNLRLRIFERQRTLLVRGLRQGEFDLIISVIDDYEMGPDVQYKILFHDRPVVVVRSSHPLTGREPIDGKELLAYPWIMPPPTSERRKHMESFLASLNIQLPRERVECQSVGFLKAVVAASDFVGLLPNDARSAEERSGLITSLPLGPVPRTRAIGVLYRRDYPLSGAAAALIRELQKASRKRRWPDE
jgi:DNA-binding transcriptional LysR family regulator